MQSRITQALSSCLVQFSFLFDCFLPPLVASRELRRLCRLTANSSERITRKHHHSQSQQSHCHKVHAHRFRSLCVCVCFSYDLTQFQKSVSEKHHRMVACLCPAFQKGAGVFTDFRFASRIHLIPSSGSVHLVRRSRTCFDACLLACLLFILPATQLPSSLPLSSHCILPPSSLGRILSLSLRFFVPPYFLFSDLLLGFLLGSTPIDSTRLASHPFFSRPFSRPAFPSHLSSAASLFLSSDFPLDKIAKLPIQHQELSIPVFRVLALESDPIRT